MWLRRRWKSILSRSIAKLAVAELRGAVAISLDKVLNRSIVQPFNGPTFRFDLFKFKVQGLSTGWRGDLLNPTLEPL